MTSDPLNEIRQRIEKANARGDYREVYKLFPELKQLERESAEYVFPKFDINRTHLASPSRDPLAQEIWKTLRRLEADVRRQLAHHESDFVYWALDHCGAVACWDITGHKVRDKPNLDQYELAP